MRESKERENGRGRGQVGARESEREQEMGAPWGREEGGGREEEGKGVSACGLWFMVYGLGFREIAHKNVLAPKMPRVTVHFSVAKPLTLARCMYGYMYEYVLYTHITS